VNFVKGHPRNPNSLEDCLEKMRACIEYSQCKPIARNFQRVSELLADLENVNDIRKVIKLLSPSDGRS
jgi:hypothetical protein